MAPPQLNMIIYDIPELRTSKYYPGALAVVYKCRPEYMAIIRFLISGMGFITVIHYTLCHSRNACRTVY